MTDQPETERTECTDGFAQPDRANTRIGFGPGEVWHTPDCPQLTILRINWEAGARRVKEQEEWARGVFPAAHERLRSCVGS